MNSRQKHTKYTPYIKRLIKELCGNSTKQTDIQNIQDIRDIHVVLEGGGFGGAYEVGVMMFLHKLETMGKIKVSKISGVSIGSIVGLLYLTNRLHEYDTYYREIRKDWYTNLQMNSLSKCVRNIVYSISQKTFDSIKNDRLYISYFNLQSKQHITKCNFVNKEDLFETIMKSTHMPLFKSKTLAYTDVHKNKYIDGLYPYIFTKQDIETYIHQNETYIQQNETYGSNKCGNVSILYVTINQLRKLHTCVDTKNEDDCFSRILHGILYGYDLFKYKKTNEYCSFVEDWTLLDITYYRLKQLVMFMCMYSIWVCNVLLDVSLPYIRNSSLLSSFIDILTTYIDDILYYFIHK